MMDLQTSELQTEYISKRSSRRFFRWLIFAPLGMLLIGSGLCIFGYTLKIWLDPKAVMNDWFLPGTLSLVLINAGIAFVGDAVRNRILYDMRRKRKAVHA
jgi:hypothetical protein